MRPPRHLTVLLLALTLLSGCGVTPEVAQPAPTFETAPLPQGPAPTRAEIVARAAAYAAHEWRARPDNALHDVDPAGVRVDTPDSSYFDWGWQTGGVVNVGVPYQWGGFSSLAEFDEGLAAGRYAGHVFETFDPEHRPVISPYAVGVDCSGLVSRCWDLPRKHSTRSLPGLCVVLPGYDHLAPGDMLDKPDNHCMLVVGWEDSQRTRIQVIEARLHSGVVEASYAVDTLQAAGFLPMRYRGLQALE